MEGRGGCCIARYAAAGVYDMSKVDRIMLRFRPIAPKPATGGGGGPVSPQGNSEVFSKSGRGKRRSSKENNTMSSSKRCNRKRRILNEEKKVTLPLLPETPGCKESILNQQRDGVVQKMMPFWLSCGQADDKKEGFLGGGGGGGLADRAALMAPQMARLGSWVTVECVTDTWVSGDGLGSTDEEKKVNLGRDTCPGFISDAMGRVTWTNEAYKEMVGGEMMVWLAMKDRLLPLPLMITTYPAFTCRVRVQYTCGKERSSLTLPCDVWRMDGGGFAWRLDTNAALCLGR